MVWRRCALISSRSRGFTPSTTIPFVNKIHRAAVDPVVAFASVLETVVCLFFDSQAHRCVYRLLCGILRWSESSCCILQCDLLEQRVPCRDISCLYVQHVTGIIYITNGHKLQCTVLHPPRHSADLVRCSDGRELQRMSEQPDIFALVCWQQEGLLLSSMRYVWKCSPWRS